MNGTSKKPLARSLVMFAMLAALTGGRLHGTADDNEGRVLVQLERSRTQFTTPEHWRNRRAALREGFLRGAKLWPLPKRTPLNPIIHGRRVHEGYSVENVALETLPGFYCTGNLYRPVGEKGPRPAILCPHGHFRPLGRMRPDQQIRCAHLARMGAVVFSYSMVGWQDSQQTTHDDPLVLALQTWNSIRALDFVSVLEEVDAHNLGATGASGGGTQTLYLVFLDDRIQASAPAVIVYPWSWFSPGCNCETGMPVMKEPETNAVELAAAIAPRPQLIISCGLLAAGRDQKDPTHNFPAVGLPFIEQVYGLMGRPEHLQSLHLEAESHDFGPSKRQAVYTFFAKHLGLKPLKEDPTTIPIEPPGTLEVFNDAHPLPPHAARGSREVTEAFERLRQMSNAENP
ncbi:MAG: acetylxylan esterase [Planctomycetes bacterium]|nr:acetylxylan esterase [Planctomycetota bacterium]